MVSLKIINESLIKYYIKVTCYHVKQKLTRVLSVFHTTPVSVPITDS